MTTPHRCPACADPDPVPWWHPEPPLDHALTIEPMMAGGAVLFRARIGNKVATFSYGAHRLHDCIARWMGAGALSENAMPISFPQWDTERRRTR